MGSMRATYANRSGCSLMAVSENGCWPLGLPDHYAADLAHLAEYARMAATAEGFKRYLDEHVYARKAA